MLTQLDKGHVTYTSILLCRLFTYNFMHLSDADQFIFLFNNKNMFLLYLSYQFLYKNKFVSFTIFSSLMTRSNCTGGHRSIVSYYLTVVSFGIIKHSLTVYSGNSKSIDPLINQGSNKVFVLSCLQYP